MRAVVTPTFEMSKRILGFEAVHEVEDGLAKMTRATPLIAGCIAGHQYFLDHPPSIRLAG